MKRTHSSQACILYILLLGSKMQELLHQRPVCLRESQTEVEFPSGSDFRRSDFPKHRTHKAKAMAMVLCCHLEMWWHICLIDLFTRLTFWCFHLCQSFRACFVSFGFTFSFACFTLSEKHYIFLIKLLLSVLWSLYLHTFFGCSLITKYSFKSIWLFFGQGLTM